MIPHPRDRTQQQVRSYLRLRQSVGFVGLLLPPVLALGVIAQGGGLQRSISAYYSTEMGDVFVGAMCAIAAFLISYKGHARVDQTLSTVAGIGAVGVAVFPARPPWLSSARDLRAAWMHSASAAVFLLTLAAISYFLFTRTGPLGPLGMTPRKRLRNRVYRGCALVIVVCVVLMPAAMSLPETTHHRYHPIFWIEALAISAFGLSWYTKGELLLKDGPA